ncbi:hypothetical protein YB2330_003585 [Saitoella coloradoensis]
MIRGIGTQIVNVRKLATRLTSVLPSSTENYLHPRERARLMEARRNGGELKFLATHWAAKQACWKAFGSQTGLGLDQIEMLHREDGGPLLKIHSARGVEKEGNVVEAKKRDKAEEASVTISHDGDYVVAFVMRQAPLNASLAKSTAQSSTRRKAMAGARAELKTSPPHIAPVTGRRQHSTCSSSEKSKKPAARGFLRELINITASTHEDTRPISTGPKLGKLGNATAFKGKTIMVSVDGETVGYDNVWLRDACPCPRCIDPSTRQKTFETSDVPETIRPRALRISPKKNGLEVIWDQSLRSQPDKDTHNSFYPYELLKQYSSHAETAAARYNSQSPVLWNKAMMEDAVLWVEYKDYMNTDQALFTVLKQLQEYGLAFIRGMGTDDEAKLIERAAERIGELKQTFYGRTWNVKSIPNSKNVAYTSLNLGLHMDLLYFESPPGLQFLHCLRNSVTGGSSYFVDSFRAAHALRLDNPMAFGALTKTPVTFHYKNDGRHFHYTRPTIVLDPYAVGPDPVIDHVNYSPPFQAPFENINQNFRGFHSALRNFADYMAKPEQVYEMTLKEGECVVFQNRRVLHARREFDAASGERWLKGAYVDIDAFRDKYRVLSEKFA